MSGFIACLFLILSTAASAQTLEERRLAGIETYLFSPKNVSYVVDKKFHSRAGIYSQVTSLLWIHPSGSQKRFLACDASYKVAPWTNSTWDRCDIVKESFEKRVLPQALKKNVKIKLEYFRLTWVPGKARPSWAHGEPDESEEHYRKASRFAHLKKRLSLSEKTDDGIIEMLSNGWGGDFIYAQELLTPPPKHNN